MRRTLDTNICSYILRKRPLHLIQRFEGLMHDQLWLSAIVAAELRYGAEKLGSQKFTLQIEHWLSGFNILPWPSVATYPYAKVRAELAGKGTPIGGMDLLIAAHAMAEDSVLVTNNSREFKRVPGLAIEEWSL